jgi:hypothetical protein
VSETISEEATKWGRLLGLARPDQGGWLPDDLAHLWRHQLQTPLDEELRGELGAAFPDGAARDRDSGAPNTLEALLIHRSPPLELLKSVQQLAKARRGQAEYPSEIATALYYVVAALGLARHGARISDMDKASFCRGLQWTCRMAWLDESTRGVVQTALKLALEA